MEEKNTYKIGDHIILKDVELKGYNGKVFMITEIHLEGIFKVFRDGFDPIYVTEQNFA